MPLTQPWQEAPDPTFWARKWVPWPPCDSAGGIHEEYFQKRLEDTRNSNYMYALGDATTWCPNARSVNYWTVRHTQEVCSDIHSITTLDRSKFDDLHKQLRELWSLHDRATRLLRPPAAEPQPDDMVVLSLGEPGPNSVEVKTIEVQRNLYDFVRGMNSQILDHWRPFDRTPARYMVDSVQAFLEDFSCFLGHHEWNVRDFAHEKVILMQAPWAPNWSAQNLNFNPARLVGFNQLYESAEARAARQREDPLYHDPA